MSCNGITVGARVDGAVVHHRRRRSEDERIGEPRLFRSYI